MSGRISRTLLQP